LQDHRAFALSAAFAKQGPEAKEGRQVSSVADEGRAKLVFGIFVEPGFAELDAFVVERCRALLQAARLRAREDIHRGLGECH
jgi:hypothetical protein